jgi:hypothetical protein
MIFARTWRRNAVEGTIRRTNLLMRRVARSSVFACMASAEMVRANATSVMKAGLESSVTFARTAPTSTRRMEILGK